MQALWGALGALALALAKHKAIPGTLVVAMLLTTHSYL
jgi:hypothetical protein